MKEYLDKVKGDLETDVTWNRIGRLSVKGAKALPDASVGYVTEKFPIIGWLPRYNYRWIINDVIAGLTLGLLLIPQGLSYAKIATIPVQYGLMSSWLPAAIYAFMGTSKDLSTGPTSLIGLLTSEIIAELQGEEWSPSEIASGVAMMMGIYGMILGFLKLGFLLDFISLPILSGFISAVAITIILNQMGSLLGEPAIGDGTANQIHDIFAKLPQASGYTCLIGFTGILLVTILDQAGKRWGQKNKIIWFLSITRAFIALVIFTGIGYAVNKNRAPSDFLFGVVQVKANGQEPPTVPSRALLSRLASRSIAIFIGSAIEHTAIARAFGVRNNYVTDQSQELTYYGITNFFNSFFHAMGVGGAMSRTAVNSACNVKSPLSGFVTTAIVLISIFKLVGTLYWIPKATLAAIIICAVWPLISSPVVFYRYWKTSLADFISSMIAFWVTLFVSTEIGIGASVGFNIVYILLRLVFARVSTTPDTNSTQQQQPQSTTTATTTITFPQRGPVPIPPDARIFTLPGPFFFPNAYRAKTAMFDTIQTHHAPAFNSVFAREAERNWSVTAEQRVRTLRRRAGITNFEALPPINVVVVDFERANHVDATGVAHMKSLVGEVRRYGGAQVEVRFVGVSGEVRERFGRAGWRVVDVGDGSGGGDGDDGDDGREVVRLFRDVASAVRAERRRVSSVGEGEDEDDSEKMEMRRMEEGESRGVRTTHREMA
ncbi:sulfate transporter family-domain-containing protein [Bombardia bombarda]|uniref:Sulfate transporter family-domain-containing protein n=1 Tax=Bombardia bombarda TaxID=252184 RepID=A0AA39WUU4_9PEZI|nr:sulfate transporter family-domain-containing protein [Bombardia bombarda]